jgi:hypothetical protein
LFIGKAARSHHVLGDPAPRLEYLLSGSSSKRPF